MCKNLCNKLCGCLKATCHYISLPFICICETTKNVIIHAVAGKLLWLFLTLVLTVLMGYQWFREMVYWGQIKAFDLTTSIASKSLRAP